jgi:capsular polysaccharide export protein
MAPNPPDLKPAGGPRPRRLFVFNGGFLTQRRVRRILKLSGWQISLGLPPANGHVGVWGKSPTSHRGEQIATRQSASVVRVEDSFLRSILPGRSGEPPLGLLIDETGVHFDSSKPSDLETLLMRAPLDDGALLARARAAIDRIRALHLSKYNGYDPADPVPEPGYVLVIDQTRGDASITHGAANATTFREMLAFAQIENPGQRIVIKTHPETVAGHRDGHFTAEHATGKISLYSDPVSPWALLDGAIAVYTVSSGMGFEAILAGHKPRVFGQPFYSGWGLTQDENPVPRRERRLTRAQLFATAMMIYPKWYDPYRDCLCTLERAIDTLEAETRAYREDRNGYAAHGMRLWKRGHLKRFFGRYGAITFQDAPEAAVKRCAADGASLLTWAGKVTPELDMATARNGVDLHRVEDGFLRSRGLGAALVPPMSLVRDDLGIYYDPTQESRLERLISQSEQLTEHDRTRAERMIRDLNTFQLSKYNVGQTELPDVPDGRIVLVPGQVEDDASIRLGTSDVSTNRALLEAARAANPNAVLIYKPHPDVEAGLRQGDVPDAHQIADIVARDAHPVPLIEKADDIWTMTSLMGFEALLRRKTVTCLGAPFYAGWGLTMDRGAVPRRRTARPDLVALAHAVLVAYPRYLDPVTGRPCPPEVVLERLSKGTTAYTGPGLRALSKLQGMFASVAPFWR